MKNSTTTYFKDLKGLYDEEIRKEINKFEKFLLNHFDKDFINFLSLGTKGISTSFNYSLLNYKRETTLLSFEKYEGTGFLKHRVSHEINFDEKIFKKLKELETIFIPKNNQKIIKKYKDSISAIFCSQYNLNLEQKLRISFNITDDFKFNFGEVEFYDDLKGDSFRELLPKLEKQESEFNNIKNKFNGKSVWDFLNKEKLDIALTKYAFYDLNNIEENLKK